jgi:histidinol-phosphate/aromatic aminotransferase/cobyric acid decarboxylase-like protein
MRTARPAWTPLPSTTNFTTFLTEGPGGGDLAAATLAAHGIRVRSVEHMQGLRGGVRISMAGHDAMRRVLDALAAGQVGTGTS